MAMEIERRWLLSGKPKIPVQAKTIEQGYLELPSAFDSFRVRIICGSSAVITLKDGRGISRDEDEESISLKMANKLHAKCHHHLNKLRQVHEGWEIDVFEGPLTGVILAEKELASEDESVEIPNWLQPYIVREVTDSLTNLHLARLATDLRGTNSSPLPYLDKHLNKIQKHVLTGGPCSGKSTIMEILKKEYPDFHFVPEVATIIIGQLGILPGDDTVSQWRFQRAIYRTQKLFEFTSAQYAVSNNKTALVLDRGTWDGSVYLRGGALEFEHAVGTSRSDEYDCYYSVTYLSVPSREIYELNKKNNSSRREGYFEAYVLGQKIYDAWKEHPSFRKATSDVWEEKVQAVRNSIGDKR